MAENAEKPDDNEASTTDAPGIDYDRLRGVVREVVRDELDHKLQDVLRVGDAPTHDEVAEMIAGGTAKSASDAEAMIAAGLSPVMARVQANETLIADLVRNLNEKVNDRLNGVIDMMSTVSKKVDSVMTEVQLYRKSADVQLQRLNTQIDQTDKRVDDIAPVVSRLDDAVFGGTDGTPGIRATVGKVHATVGRIDQWVQTQIQRQERRDQIMGNIWKFLNYPAVKFGLLALLGSAAGVSVLEIVRAIS